MSGINEKGGIRLSTIPFDFKPLIDTTSNESSKESVDLSEFN